jgi:hypothetical protein
LHLQESVVPSVRQSHLYKGTLIFLRCPEPTVPEDVRAQLIRLRKCVPASHGGKCAAVPRRCSRLDGVWIKSDACQPESRPGSPGESRSLRQARRAARLHPIEIRINLARVRRSPSGRPSRLRRPRARASPSRSSSPESGVGLPARLPTGRRPTVAGPGTTGRSLVVTETAGQ